MTLKRANFFSLPTTMAVVPTMRDSHICMNFVYGDFDDRLTLYSISKITEDQSTYTTYLTAEIAAWSDVAGTYDLDFGQITPYQQTSGVQERGLGKCLFSGSCDESKSVTFEVAAGTKGKVSNIYSDSKFKLDCINCFTTGSFQLAGHISV